MWNYRAFRTQYRMKLSHEKVPHIEKYFTIRETYYDDGGKVTMISGSDQGISPSGNSYDELRNDFHHMTIAMTKPVLTPLDIPGYVYGEDEVPFTKEELLSGDTSESE